MRHFIRPYLKTKILKIERILQIVFLILFMSITSCNEKDPEDKSVDFEQKVFDEIFLAAVDSTLIDMRTYIGFQYSDQQRDSIRKDTLNRVVAFNIVNNKVPIDILTEIPKKYNTINDSIWNFNLEKYRSPKYIFKNASELSLDRELIEWQKKYIKFSGALSFSKIYFDKQRENGVFEAGYYCGSKCAVGFVVYLKKIKNNWIVIKIERSWIS